MDIIGTVQSMSGLSFKEMLQHPTVFGLWTATLLGLIVTFGKSIPGALYERLKRYLSITLTIDESDNVSGYDVFDSFNKWVVEHRVEWLSRSFEVDVNQKIQSGQGFQIVVFEGSLFFINMARREPKGQMSLRTIGYYTIQTAKWNRSKLDRLVNASTSLKDYGQLILSESNHDTSGFRFDYPEYVKHQQQLISPKVYNRISNAFDRFNKGRGWYNDNCLPYKECIMLYGPPGTGKTSLIRHLAALHNMNLVLLSPDALNPNLVAKYGSESKSKNTKTIILLEDITSFKALLKEDDSAPADNAIASRISDNQGLSGFLNTLDGAVPLDNVIIVMTTNHINLLDSAVYRPGRVDHRICMEYMTFDEVNDSILKWSEDDERMKVFKGKFPSNQITANTIMKLNSCSAKDLSAVLIDEIVSDNETFIQLHEDETVEES